MHQPRPYGLHVIGQALTNKDSAFIDNAAKKITNLKELSGLDGLKLVYDLPDGGAVLVIDMGGNFRVIAHKPLDEDRVDFDGIARLYIPMLFSGAISGSALLKPNQGLPLKLSKQTQRRLNGYDGTSAPSNVELMRFVCEYGRMFQEFVPQNKINGLVYTQYIQQRPTWYSGAMSEVMQIVGGYGKQQLNELPDNPIERAVMKIPPRYQARIEGELGIVRLPCYRGLPHESGSFQCDYKYLNTNLVGFDDSNEPWLLQVGASGVWAMPLPIIPATKTQAFYDYIHEVGDTEILAILNRFGAMPSGESFPSSPLDFEAWRRAGVIIKVCDTKDFYEHMAYSTAMGWSMNDAGNEAVNTCHNIDEDAALVYGMTYKLRLRLGQAKNRGWSIPTKSEVISTRQFTNKYLQGLYSLIVENSAVNLAIKYKISRSSAYDIAVRARGIVGDVTKTEFLYWHNLELEPIAKHEGNVSQIDKGYLFEGRNIKVPEPYIGGCASLQLLPLRGNFGIPKTDTVILAYYIGDNLKVVRSFSDSRPHENKTEGNFEKNMIVGEWWEKEYLGAPYVQGALYTSDIDDRRLVAPTEIYKEVKGIDLGFGQPNFNFTFYFWIFGTFTRYRWYTTETKTKTLYSPSVSIAVTMPYYCRNALLYAKTDKNAMTREAHSLVRSSIQDPYYYEFWTYHSSWASSGTLEVMNGSPFPVDGRPVYAEIQHYAPNDVSDFADDGPWLPALPYDITSLMYKYNTVIWAKDGIPPPPPANTFNISKDSQSDISYELKCSIYSNPDFISNKSHDSHYYLLSPDTNNNVFYRDATKVVFGSNRYANVSEVTETGNRKQWGESSLVDNKSAHHFIGVINE